MKKLFLLTINLLFAVILLAQVSNTINVSAGGLSAVLTNTEKSTITNLTLTGTLDARDFKTMRDSMPLLAVVDISGVKIVEYYGNKGTFSGYYNYVENSIPAFAFYSPITWSGKNSLTKFVLPDSVNSIDQYSFRECQGLSSIRFPDGLKSIGYQAFNSSFKLSNILIPSTITTISDFAFTRCFGPINVNELNQFYSDINGILFNKEQTQLIQYPLSIKGNYSIPSTVKIIGKGAFMGYEGTVVSIPSSVKTIDESSFQYSSLSRIEIPEGVVSINRQAFFNCTELKFLLIPSSVDTIGSNAFNSCWNLDTIMNFRSLPVDLSSSSNVFQGAKINECKLFVRINSITNYQAAYQWKDFININGIPAAIPSSDTISFGANQGTKKLIILSRTNWSALSNQEWLTINPISHFGNDSLSIAVSLNSTNTVKKAIITISSEGFADQYITVIQFAKTEVTAGNLKEILSGNLSTISYLTLTGSIDARDFKTMRDSMPVLTSVDLSGVSISAYIGTEGTSINTIYPANSIPDYAFMKFNGQGKESLTSIVFPESLNSIGQYSFARCSGLVSLYLTSSINQIGNSAFWDCIGLKKVNIPSSVSSIGVLAFLNSVDSIAVDQNNLYYSSIDGVLFNKTGTELIQCPNSRTGNYIIPPFVTTVKSHSFYNCRKLTSLALPSSVSSIESYALFSLSGTITADEHNANYSSNNGILFNKTQTELIQCPISKTGDYTIPPSVSSIGRNAFSYCSGLTNIIIPSSVISIGSSAFQSCHGLTTVNIPNSVISIGDFAFYGCAGLSKVIIPSSVFSLGSYSFSGCNALTSIHVYCTYPINLNSSFEVFSNVNKTSCTLYVPYGSKPAYQNAVQWQDFQNIVEDSTGFYISQKSLVLSFNPIDTVIPVLANISWSVTSNQDWLTITPSNSTGHGAITLTASENYGLPRVAVVTVSASDQMDQKVIVSQLSSSSIADANLIHNGEFITDGGLPSPWGFYTGNTGVAPTVQNGIAICTPIKDTVNIWTYQFYQEGLKALPNVDYLFCFSIWSDNERTIQISFEDPGNNYIRYGKSSDPEAQGGSSEWRLTIQNVPTTYLFHVNFDNIQSNTIQKVNFMLAHTADKIYLDHVYLIPANVLNIIPASLVVSGQTFQNGAIECFNALDTITVAGNSTVEFQSGSSITLIAGKSIRFLPGFFAHSGSSMDAKITTNNTFCDGASKSIVSLPVEKSTDYVTDRIIAPVTGIRKLVKVYPNPNTGRFTVELSNFENYVDISLYNTLGARVFQSATNLSNYDIDLPGIQKGIYFIKVTNGKDQITKKMVVN